MGLQSRGHIIFNYTETVQSCCNKIGICREREKNSLPSYKVPFNGSWLLSATWSIIIRMVDGHYFEMVQLFTHPTGIQLALYSIMQLIWCVCKSCIPCSSRDCGYKRNGFDFWIYSSLQLFWFLWKSKKLICPVIIFRLDSTVDGEIWHLKSFHSEFTRSRENVRFGSKIITLDG
jgi:hypothetical protein